MFNIKFQNIRIFMLDTHVHIVRLYLKDIVPSSVYERVDKDLQDAQGIILRRVIAALQNISDGMLACFNFVIITGLGCCH